MIISLAGRSGQKRIISRLSYFAEFSFLTCNNFFCAALISGLDFCFKAIEGEVMLAAFLHIGS